MTPEVVLLLTPFKAPRALPAGVKVFDTTREVSYSHKHLTPLFGVATTPLFLQCMYGLRVCMQSCTYTHGLYLQNKIVINIVVCMNRIHIELLLSQNIKMEVYS